MSAHCTLLNSLTVATDRGTGYHKPQWRSHTCITLECRQAAHSLTFNHRYSLWFCFIQGEESRTRHEPTVLRMGLGLNHSYQCCEHFKIEVPHCVSVGEIRLTTRGAVEVFNRFILENDGKMSLEAVLTEGISASRHHHHLRGWIVCWSSGNIMHHTLHVASGSP